MMNGGRRGRAHLCQRRHARMSRGGFLRVHKRFTTTSHHILFLPTGFIVTHISVTTATAVMQQRIIFLC